MSATQFFQLVEFVSLLLPIAVTISVLLCLPRPRNIIGKSLVAIVVAWTVSVVFTSLAYNPAGIAFAVELGTDSPNMKFDNNTIASALAGGWLLPTVAASAFFLARRIIRRRRNGEPHA